MRLSPCLRPAFSPASALGEYVQQAIAPLLASLRWLHRLSNCGCICPRFSSGGCKLAVQQANGADVPLPLAALPRFGGILGAAPSGGHGPQVGPRLHAASRWAAIGGSGQFPAFRKYRYRCSIRRVAASRMIEARAQLSGESVPLSVEQDARRERLSERYRRGGCANPVHLGEGLILEKAGILHSPARGQFSHHRARPRSTQGSADSAGHSLHGRGSRLSGGRKQTRPRPSSLEPSPSEAEATPEEELESASSAFKRTRRGTAPERRRLSPTAFEHLVVDLMIGMGYGGGRPEQARSRKLLRTEASTASSTKIA